MWRSLTKFSDHDAATTGSWLGPSARRAWHGHAGRRPEQQFLRLQQRAPGGANRNTVTDFNHANDTFQLENAVFKAQGGGALKAVSFVVGTAAHDADDDIIYNHSTGLLSYDANGNATGGAVQVAVLAMHQRLPPMTS